MNKKNLKIFFLLAIIIFLYFLSTNIQSEPKEYKVFLTGSGFSPKNLKIKNGDSVIFESKTQSVFWPASDLHPSHLVYPEFDPKEPIKVGSSWRFKFEKKGSWGFHDHLNPSNRGNVVVGGFLGSKTISNVSDFYSKMRISVLGKDSYFASFFDMCPKSEKFEFGKKCWEEALTQIDKHFGIEASFDFLQEGVKKDKSLAGTCHYYAEYIGFLAYERFYKGETPEFYSKSNMCGYGYYHAFLQEWVSHKKDITDAKEYCYKADANGDEFSKDNCFLGIGLGLTFLNLSEYYGKDDAIIEKSVLTCRNAFENDERMQDACIDGALSGLAHLYFGDHGLSLNVNKSDPFWVCNRVDTGFKSRCYQAITEVVFFDLNQDFKKTTDFILKVKNRDIENASIERLGTTLYNTIYFQDQEGTKGLNFCHTLEKNEHKHFCLVGYLRRYISVNLRSEDVNKNKSLVCKNPEFSATETSVCNNELALFIKNNEQGF